MNEIKGMEAEYILSTRSRSFVLPPIWPAREVHILTGESGVGKSTLMAQWLNALDAGEMVMGLKPGGRFRSIYISLERSHKSVKLSDDLGWGLRCPYASLKEAVEGLGMAPNGQLNVEVLKKICARYSEKGFRVICLDPIASFCSKPNDQNAVRKFLLDQVVEEICQPLDVTIIATGHPAKEREGSRIQNVRQKVAGSYGWGAFSNCNMHLSKVDPDDHNSTDVQLEVSSRHSKPFTMQYERGPKGELVEKEDKLVVKEAGKLFVMDGALDGKEGTRVGTTELVEWGEGRKISVATVYRWLKAKKEEGRLVEEGRGEYKVVSVGQGVGGGVQ